MIRKQPITVAHKELSVFPDSGFITSDYLIRGLGKRAVALAIQERRSYLSPDDTYYIDTSDAAIVAYAAYASKHGWKKAQIYWSHDWERYLICNGNSAARDGHWWRDLGYRLPPVPQPKEEQGSCYDGEYDSRDWYDAQELAYLD
jgi:hypothetical protein